MPSRIPRVPRSSANGRARSARRSRGSRVGPPSSSRSGTAGSATRRSPRRPERRSIKWARACGARTTHFARRPHVDNIDSNEKLLAMPPLAVDADEGLARLASTIERTGARPAARAMPAFLYARQAKWLAAAAGVVIVATTLTMTGVADSILQIFEAKQVAAVTITPTDIKTLGQLSQFGKLTWSSQPEPHQVASLAAATAETGLPAISVKVPASITGAAQYGAMTKTTATFVLDASLARASAAAIGRTAAPMPAKLDGSTLVFSGGPAIVISYGSEKSTS